MENLVSKFLDKLTGFDFWFILFMFIIGLAGWYYFGKQEPNEKKIVKRQLLFTGFVVIISILGICINHLCFSPDYSFSKGIYGILILGIEGDDENQSLQRDLCNSINNLLENEFQKQKIEVRLHPKIITEKFGIKNAHDIARRIGKKNNALLVIWGNRIEEKKFHPRLTVVKKPPKVSMQTNFTFYNSQVNELSLPPELVLLPIDLTNFIAGYISYYDKNFNLAIHFFEKSLERTLFDEPLLNKIRVMIGDCYLSIPYKGKKNIISNLSNAFALYESSLTYYSKKNFPFEWAKIQNNLGFIYLNLPTDELNENYNKSINYLKFTLEIFTEKDHPIERAKTYVNLGAAYAQLTTGNLEKNISEAIVANETALKLLNKEKYPYEWACAQINLSTALSKYDHKIDYIKKSIEAAKAAEKVYKKINHQYGWAVAQWSLGLSYSDLNSDKYFILSIKHLEQSLQVFKEKEYPVNWAKIQMNLGGIYWKLPTGNRKDNLHHSLNAYKLSLSVFKENYFKVDWATTQLNMANTLVSLSEFEGNNIIFEAIEACNNALKIFKIESFPVRWTLTQNILGLCYRNLSSGDRCENLKIALSHFNNMLTVCTPEILPDYYKIAHNNIDLTNKLLSEFKK